MDFGDGARHRYFLDTGYNSPMASRKKLVILDTHAIIHRAYHALPPLSNSKGQATGALYGVVTMLLKIIAELKPDYMVACRDLPGGTFRDTMFEAYKAHRAQLESELISQLEYAPKIFEAFGMPVYCAKGFEADDCIGTIVHELKSHKDIDVIIATGDMDTLQLVDGKKVQVYTLRKGLNDTILYDSDRVHERYGFGPEHVVDYKALRGDPSDNIPGIKGIGEKTGEQLVQNFGSIEEMYAVLSKGDATFIEAGVKARMIELVRNGRESAELSKKLATIRSDAPIEFKVPSEWHLEMHAESVAKLCDELEFRTLRDRVRKLSGNTESTATTDASVEEVKEQSTQASTEGIDPEELRETGIALWIVRSDYTNPSLDDMLGYATTEDYNTARAKILADLNAVPSLRGVFDRIEKPLMVVVQQMHVDGVAVDNKVLKHLQTEYTKELDLVAARIHGAAGHEFNINSPKQLGVVLYDELHINPVKQKKTATGARTTREDELVKLAEMHPIINDVLAYRELSKLLGTYIEKIPALVDKYGRLHTTFVQTGAATGRMSCEDPNLQNIPIKTEYGRRIREAFVAPKGRVLVAIDYSQIELRIAAGLSSDAALVAVFKEGRDIHTEVASRVFGVPADKVDREMRRRAKVINFGILYGMGANALKDNLGAGVKRDEASTYLDDYFKNFSGLALWIEEVKQNATRLGYTETLFGRRRYFPGLKSPLPQLRAQAERMAVNAPIQGAQSDIIKLAMVEADRVIKENGWREVCTLVLQVHDELVYEMSETKANEMTGVIKKVMEDVAPIDKLSGVPIVAEAKKGKNWGVMTPGASSHGRNATGMEK